MTLHTSPGFLHTAAVSVAARVSVWSRVEQRTQESARTGHGGLHGVPKEAGEGGTRAQIALDTLSVSTGKVRGAAHTDSALWAHPVSSSPSAVTLGSPAARSGRPRMASGARRANILGC